MFLYLLNYKIKTEEKK